VLGAGNVAGLKGQSPLALAALPRAGALLIAIATSSSVTRGADYGRLFFIVDSFIRVVVIIVVVFHVRKERIGVLMQRTHDGRRGPHGHLCRHGRCLQVVLHHVLLLLFVIIVDFVHRLLRLPPLLVLWWRCRDCVWRLRVVRPRAAAAGGPAKGNRGGQGELLLLLVHDG
jgi:hypothetical protein